MSSSSYMSFTEPFLGLLWHAQMPAMMKKTSATPTATAAAVTPASHLSGHVSDDDDDSSSEGLAGDALEDEVLDDEGVEDALEDGSGEVLDDDEGSDDEDELEEGSGEMFDELEEDRDEEGSDDEEGSGEMLEDEEWVLDDVAVQRFSVSTHCASGWQQ